MIVRRVILVILVLSMLAMIALFASGTTTDGQRHAAVEQARENMRRVLVLAERAREANAPLAWEEVYTMAKHEVWPRGKVSYHPVFFHPAAGAWALWAEPSVQRSWTDSLRFWERDDVPPVLILHAFQPECLDRGIVEDVFTG